jgi:hypothetical protein
MIVDSAIQLQLLGWNMIVTRLTKTVSLILLILATSCDDDSPTGHRPEPIETHFPNAIGMLWKYQVYDSLTEVTDTVWFSVTDTFTLSTGDFVTLWREKRIGAERHYFRLSFLGFRGDTLETFDDSVGVPANERIVFPLELSSSWTGPVAVDDTSTVAQIGQIEVPAGKFNNGARIDRSWNLDFEEGGNWSQTWVVPDVGVVSRYRRSQFSDGTKIIVTTNEIWELIEYDLTTFGLHQFPNKVGNAWVYEEVDSVRGGLDTIVVTFDTITATIVDSGRLESGAPYTLWEFLGRDGIDTQYVVTNAWRLSFGGETIFGQRWAVRYLFPMTVGRFWGIYSLVPLPLVLDKEPVVTPIQTFASSFHTYLEGESGNDNWTQQDWLVSGVGIVKSRRWQFGSWPSMNRTRTLIDYQLAD